MELRPLPVISTAKRAFHLVLAHRALSLVSVLKVWAVFYLYSVSVRDIRNIMAEQMPGCQRRTFMYITALTTYWGRLEDLWAMLISLAIPDHFPVGTFPMLA